MINVNYQKRKNLELFKCLEKSETLFLSNAQNYIPIYNKFFTLNDSNYNSINLNNKWNISNVNDGSEDDFNLFNCRLKNTQNNKKSKNIILHNLFIIETKIWEEILSKLKSKENLDNTNE